MCVNAPIKLDMWFTLYDVLSAFDICTRARLVVIFSVSTRLLVWFCFFRLCCWSHLEPLKRRYWTPVIIGCVFDWPRLYVPNWLVRSAPKKSINFALLLSVMQQTLCTLKQLIAFGGTELAIALHRIRMWKINRRMKVIDRMGVLLHYLISLSLTTCRTIRSTLKVECWRTLCPEKKMLVYFQELKITAAVVASSSFISFPFDGATRPKWAIYWKVDSKFIFKHLYCVLTATISSVKLTGQTLNTSANGFECFRITTCHLLKNENKTARRRKWETEIKSTTQNRNVQKHASEYRVCVVSVLPPPPYHIQHAEHS